MLCTVVPPERGWCSLEPPRLTRRGVVERGAGLWSYSPPSNVTPLPPPPQPDNTHSLAMQVSGVMVCALVSYIPH